MEFMYIEANNPNHGEKIIYIGGKIDWFRNENLNNDENNRLKNKS